MQAQQAARGAGGPRDVARAQATRTAGPAGHVRSDRGSTGGGWWAGAICVHPCVCVRVRVRALAQNEVAQALMQQLMGGPTASVREGREAALWLFFCMLCMLGGFLSRPYVGDRRVASALRTWHAVPRASLLPPADSSAPQRRSSPRPCHLSSRRFASHRHPPAWPPCALCTAQRAARPRGSIVRCMFIHSCASRSHV